MFNWLPRWFSRLFPRPVFAGDEERTRIAAVSNDLIGVILLCYAVYGVASLALGFYSNPGNVIVGWTCWAALLGLRVLLVRGWVRSATFAVACVIALAAIITTYRLAQISVAHFAWSLLAINFAVLTLGPAVALFIMCSTLGFFGWLGYMSTQGLLTASTSPSVMGQYTMIFAQSIILFTIGALIRRHMLDANQQTLIEHQALELEREAKRRLLENQNRTLEMRVNQRTAELKQANADLQRASQHLLQSEKLAALGGLVAGVAHELNTPIGNARLTASGMSARMEAMAAQVRSGQVSRSQMDEFFASGIASMELIERATERSCELVESFKQIAVDQTGMQRRVFDLRRTAEQTVLMLGPMVRRTAYTITLDIPEGIEMDGYPGGFEQIINNFVTNALMHGFTGRSQGQMRLSASLPEPGRVEIRFADDGVGMVADVQPRVFEPFFTTKFGQGGSGLGLYTVYNLVNSVFGGTIRLESKPGAGTEFILQLPLVSPASREE